MDLNSVIIRPIITEKSMDDAGKGKFTFEVLKNADKRMIKRAIEEKFKVKVLNVATSSVRGKKRRFGARRIEVTGSSWKKAIAKLGKDQKIDLFDTA